MAKPIKLRDFLKRVKDLDPTIEVFVNRGKGSHLMLCKDTHGGKVSFPVPTSSGEVAGPYQKAVIRRFGDTGGGVMVDPYEDSIYQATGIPGLCGNVGVRHGGAHAPKHSQGIGTFAST